MSEAEGNLVPQSRKPRPPQSYENYKHHTGPFSYEFETDAKKRRQRKYHAKKGLLTKATQMSTMVNASIFIKFQDNNRPEDTWIWTNNEGWCQAYRTVGLTPEEAEMRIDEKGERVVKILRAGLNPGAAASTSASSAPAPAPAPAPVPPLAATATVTTTETTVESTKPLKRDVDLSLLIRSVKNLTDHLKERKAKRQKTK